MVLTPKYRILKSPVFSACKILHKTTTVFKTYTYNNSQKVSVMSKKALLVGHPVY